MNARNLLLGVLFSMALLAMGQPRRVQGQYIGISGFTVKDLGNNTYQFKPVCKNGNKCTGKELGMHLYLWEFGDGDYSFDSIPTKQYHTAGAFNVVLRVTGIYEDIDRKRECPPDSLKTVAVDTQAVQVAKPLPYPDGTFEAKVFANAIVKAGYPVQYEYQLVNMTGLDMPISGFLSRDARQYWKAASPNVPYTALYSTAQYASMNFNPADSTLKFGGKIAPYATASVVVTYTGSAQASGDDLWARVFVYPCNPSTYCDTVEATTLNRVGKSWDPNSIESIPDRFAVAGEDMVYVIPFENEGEAAAKRIVIVDTLPPNLDIGTFKNIHTSHPEYLDTVMVNGRVVTWVFEDIYLPVRRPDDVIKRNVGYVTFRVRVNPYSYAKTFIHNQAHITFDDHVAIATNVERNKVLKADCEPSITYRSYNFLIILLIIMVALLIWVIARYRLRNPVTLQQIRISQQGGDPTQQMQQQSQQQDIDLH